MSHVMMAVFDHLPRGVLSRAEITFLARFCWLYQDAKGEIQIKHKILAKQTSYSLRAVQYLIKRLEQESNIIKVRRSKKKKVWQANSYRFNFKTIISLFRGAGKVLPEKLMTYIERNGGLAVFAPPPPDSHMYYNISSKLINIPSDEEEKASQTGVTSQSLASEPGGSQENVGLRQAIELKSNHIKQVLPNVPESFYRVMAQNLTNLSERGHNVLELVKYSITRGWVKVCASEGKENAMGKVLKNPVKFYDEIEPDRRKICKGPLHTPYYDAKKLTERASEGLDAIKKMLGMVKCEKSEN